MKDIFAIGLFVLSFAALVTIHAAIAGRLALSARPRWRGLAALVVPPLAPIWAYREGWRRSAVIWFIAVITCALALVVAEN